MKYIDAGYIAALSVLAAYAVALVLRHRHLERLVGGRSEGRPQVEHRPGP